MYPSSSYVNTSFTDNDTNPNLGIQELFSSSSCLFHFPSPYIQYEDEAIYLQQLHDILYQTDQNVVDTNENNVIENVATSSKNEAVVKQHLSAGEGTTNHPVKKKMSKKDRHSKINTAHGPRDRRMRLSLDVARKFFGLQDILGFDKASKTVEWLLRQSKIAIKELTGGLPHTNKSSSVVTVSASSTSDCEVMSGIDESLQENKTTKSGIPASSCSKEKRTRHVRKPTFHPLAKESREKARERARERTKEKKKQQKLDDQQLINLVSWSPFGSGNESSGTSHKATINYNNPPSFEVPEMQIGHQQQMQSQVTSEEINNINGESNLFVTGNWRPSGFFNYQDTFGTSHEQQFTNFQLYGYNN